MAFSKNILQRAPLHWALAGFFLPSTFPAAAFLPKRPCVVTGPDLLLFGKCSVLALHLVAALGLKVERIM